MGARGDEQRVQELAIAIERFVAGDELDDDLVLARPRRLGGNDQVSVLKRRRDSGAAGTHAPDAIGRLREVEDDPMRRGEREPDDCTSLHRFAQIGRDDKRKVVAQRANGGGAFPRQRLGNTAAGRRGAGLVCQRHGQ